MQAWITVVSWSFYFRKSVFSFRTDGILKSDWDFISNWKFPDRQAVIESTAVVYEHTKGTHKMCSPIGHNNTKHCLCPIRSRHPLEFLEMVRWESVPRGSFARNENFRAAFSPDPNDCPWVSEDSKYRTPSLSMKYSLLIFHSLQIAVYFTVTVRSEVHHSSPYTTEDLVTNTSLI